MSKLIKADLFGKSLSFENDNSRKFSTAFGGIISIVLMITSFSLAIIFGSDLYLHELPLVTNSETLKDTSVIYLKDLPMLFGFFDSSGNQILDPFDIISISVNKVYIKENITLQYSESFTFCSSQMYPKYSEVIDTMLKVSPYKFICYNSTINESIRNKLGDYDSITYMIEVSSCDTTKRKCHPDLQKILQGFYAVVYYVNEYLNPKNYNKPLSSSIESISQLLANGYTKYHYLRTAENTFSSDNGWLRESLNLATYNSLFSLTSDINTSVKGLYSGRDVYYSLSLEAAKVTKLTYRSYIKITDVLSKIGGLITVIFYALKPIISFYSNFKYTFLLKSYFLETACAKLMSRFKVVQSSHQVILNSNISIPNPILLKENSKHNQRNESHIAGPNANISSYPIILNSKTLETDISTENFKGDFKKYLLSKLICCFYRKALANYMRDRMEIHKVMSIKNYVGITRVLFCDEYFKSEVN